MEANYTVYMFNFYQRIFSINVVLDIVRGTENSTDISTGLVSSLS